MGRILLLELSPPRRRVLQAMLTLEGHQVTVSTDGKAAAEEIGARLGLSGFPLEKARRQAQAFPRSRLEKAYSCLLETDLAIKTGRLSGELALDLLVAELGCSPHGRGTTG